MREKLGILLLAMMTSTAPAAAEDQCRQYSWAMGRAIDLFADGYMPTVESALGLPKEGVFALRLKVANAVVYPVAPDRGSDSGYGGTVTLESIPAGRYLIALSEDAWVDGVEEHARLPVLAADRVWNCPGVRQTIQFNATGKPLTIQIGGVRVGQLNIAVVRIWNFERTKP